MNFRTFLVLLLLHVLRTSMSVEVEFDDNPDVYWENFKKAFQKSYAPAEEPVRRTNFEENLKQINDHNLKYQQGLHTFYMGLSKWTDMSNEEFHQTVNGLKLAETNPPIVFEFSSTADAPDSVDWREEGAVTPVKDQGNCGSCYSFSATGALEAQNKIKYGEMVSLSEQNIVDCSGPYGNNGCHGGAVQYAFEYVIDNDGIESEESYPYIGKQFSCMYHEDDKASGCIKYYDITPGEDALKQAVAQVGPISVSIDASQLSFQHYSGGIYDEPNCFTNVSHAVLVVGYGSEDDTDYWIVKNSWGTDWGEDGYVRMIRNNNNQCEIASYGCFPVV